MLDHPATPSTQRTAHTTSLLNTVTIGLFSMALGLVLVLVGHQVLQPADVRPLATGFLAVGFVAVGVGLASRKVRFTSGAADSRESTRQLIKARPIAGHPGR